MVIINSFSLTKGGNIMHVLNDTLLDEYKTTLINNEKSIATIDKYMRDMKAFMTYVRRRHGKNADIDKEVVLFQSFVTCWRSTLMKTVSREDAYLSPGTGSPSTGAICFMR